jgi:hypothetical protein
MDAHPDDDDDKHQEKCAQAIPNKHIAGRIYYLFHVRLLIAIG